MTAFLLISTGILLLIAVPIGMAMGTASLLTILQGGTLNALSSPRSFSAASASSLCWLFPCSPWPVKS